MAVKLQSYFEGFTNLLVCGNLRKKIQDDFKKADSSLLQHLEHRVLQDYEDKVTFILLAPFVLKQTFHCVFRNFYLTPFLQYTLLKEERKKSLNISEGDHRFGVFLKNISFH